MTSLVQHNKLQKLASRPPLVRWSVFEPTDQFGSFYFRALVCRLHFTLLAIDELPLLLFDCDKTLLELVSTQDDGEWDFVPLSRGELCRQLRLILKQEVGLNKRRAQQSPSPEAS